MPVREPDPMIVDGRSARRDRNREAVLDAVIDLFVAGHLSPTPAQVAERSGVSLRSVYRYVSDADELVRAALAVNWERTRPLVELGEIGPGPRAERIEALVRARLRLFAAVAPTFRAAMAAAPHQPLIAERLQVQDRRMRHQVDAAFAPELERLGSPQRREVRATLHLLLGFEAVEQLRVISALSEAASRRAMVRAVTALLDATDRQAQPPA